MLDNTDGVSTGPAPLNDARMMVLRRRHASCSLLVNDVAANKIDGYGHFDKSVF